MGSSDGPRRERWPGLGLSNEGTEIAGLIGLEVFGFLTGEFVGVFFGVDCFGDLDPKLQNECDFLVGDGVAGEALSRLWRTAGVGG